MKELIEKAIQEYINDTYPTDPEIKIVYEYIGLMQMDEGLEFEETGKVLIDNLYGNE